MLRNICLFFGFGTALIAAVPPVTPDNPQPLEGDLVLPMPGGREMVFRPVQLGVGDNPFASREFMIGDRTGRFDREKPVKVRVGGSFVIDKGKGCDVAYYLGKYEVTEAQFAAISNGNISTDIKSLPKVNVTRSNIDGFMNAYNIWLNKNASDKLPKRDQAKGFLRLPTENEWEFAARGGSVASPDIFEQACPWAGRSEEYEWFAGPTSSHGKLKPVGNLKPGPLGIHDMLGNASELTDTRYELERGGGLVGGWTVRGGDFRTPSSELRASLRVEIPERDASGNLYCSDSIGFRLAIAAQVLTHENSRDIAGKTAVIRPPTPIISSRKKDIDNPTTMPGWTIIHFQERDYVTANNILSFYRFADYKKDGDNISFTSPVLVLKGTIGSQEFIINNIKFIMSHPIVELSGITLISRLDLCKLIDPVLRPSYIDNGQNINTVVIDPSFDRVEANDIAQDNNQSSVTLNIANLLQQELESHNIHVVMTRQSDKFLAVNDRIALANKIPNINPAYKCSDIF